MGWLKSFKMIIESNVTTLRERFEDPERVLHHLLLEMEDELDAVRRNVAEAIADEKQLRKKVETAEEDVERWEGRAEAALREKQEDFAKRALEQKILATERVAALSVEHAKQAAETDKLKAAVRELEDKIRQARHKKTLLLARLVRADSTKRINAALQRTRSTSAFSDFGKLEQRVERAEALCEAWDDLDENQLAAGDLEREFEDKERAHRLQKELKELRRRLDSEAGDA